MIRRLLPCLMSHSFAAALILALTLPARAQTTAASAAPLTLTLIHINDPHGQLEGRTNKDNKPVGGYARLATYVANARKSSTADALYFLHAGDEFSKGDPLTMATKGKANIDILNHLTLDLWVPGNGEYYGGVDNLRARIAEAKFPVITANISDPSGRLVYDKPYLIKNVGPAKVAFLGLGTMHDFQAKDTGLTLKSPIETARALLPEIRRKADIVIAVTHIGVDEDTKLITAVAGIDLVIGGHSHTVLPTGKLAKNPDGKSILICQTGQFLQFVGRVDTQLVKSPSGWTLAHTTARLDPLDAKTPEDPALKALIAQHAAALTPTPASAP